MHRRSCPAARGTSTLHILDCSCAAGTVFCSRDPPQAFGGHTTQNLLHAVIHVPSRAEERVPAAVQSSGFPVCLSERQLSLLVYALNLKVQFNCFKKACGFFGSYICILHPRRHLNCIGINRHHSAFNLWLLSTDRSTSQRSLSVNMHQTTMFLLFFPSCCRKGLLIGSILLSDFCLII